MQESHIDCRSQLLSNRPTPSSAACSSRAAARTRWAFMELGEEALLFDEAAGEDAFGGTPEERGIAVEVVELAGGFLLGQGAQGLGLEAFRFLRNDLPIFHPLAHEVFLAGGSGHAGRVHSGGAVGTVLISRGRERR